MKQMKITYRMPRITTALLAAGLLLSLNPAALEAEDILAEPGEEKTEDSDAKSSEGSSSSPGGRLPFKTSAGNSIGTSGGEVGLMARQRYMRWDQGKASSRKPPGLTERIQWQVDFITEGAAFNNADLRSLDESYDAAIETTDDKRSFVATSVHAGFFFPISEDVAFNVSLWKYGLWGHDQLGGRDTVNDASSNIYGANTVSFGQDLNVEMVPFLNKDRQMHLIIGRQFFEIGGASNDFVMRDILDGITLTYHERMAGRLDVLLLDMFWSGSSVNDVTYVQYISGDNEKVDNFDGDVNTIRHGFVYTTSNFFKWGERVNEAEVNDAATLNRQLGSYLKLYSFLSNFGAGNEGGSDRTNLGAQGNFADNDYAMLYGARTLFNFQQSTLWLGYARSEGVDRRAKSFDGSKTDIDTNGNAIEAGLEVSVFELDPLKKAIPKSIKTLEVQVRGQFFMADGPVFNKDGLQTSHGFTSFKGDHVGGLLLNRYYGWHPSAYTDDDGIDDWPHDMARKSGTQLISAGLTVGYFRQLYFDVDLWLLSDTGSSTVSNILSRTEQAQQRLGKSLGREIDGTLRYEYNRYLRFYLTMAMFQPDRFFETVGLYDNAPQGNQTFYGAQLGMALQF